MALLHWVCALLGGTSGIQIRFQDHTQIQIWELMEKERHRDDNGRQEKGETQATKRGVSLECPYEA